MTALQRELLEGFFAREQRLFLTGGGALAGFYLGHRDTEDLDLFSSPGLDLADATRAMQDAAAACGASTEALQTFPDFRRLLVSRDDETCKVDLVIDRAPIIEIDKASFGSIRVDTLREIAANKICTLLSRSEPKDLVDLQALLALGIDLEQALQDAEKKDAGVDPATLSWLLDQISIDPAAILPGGVDARAIDQLRKELSDRLRRLAFTGTR